MRTFAGVIAVILGLANLAFGFQAREAGRGEPHSVAPFEQLVVQSDFLVLGQPTEIISSAVVFRPFDLALAPDGSKVLIDFSTNEIIKVGADGAIAWRTGGRGQGPGEFQTLYRVAVGPEGSIGAFDMATRELSWFDENGAFERRVQLPTRLQAITDMVILTGRRVAFAGVAPYGGFHSVRVFDEQLRMVASFGPLPPVRNERVLTYWGAGGISLDGDRQLLFTLKLPYEIYRFSVEGELLNRFDGPGDFTRGPDDAFVEFDNGFEVGVSEASEYVPFPVTAKSLGRGWVLGGVTWGPDRGSWDLFRADELVESFPAPNGWFVSEVDPVRSFVYLSTRDSEGNKVYLRAAYSLRQD